MKNPVPIGGPAVIVTVGLPGSGKTTWTDAQIAANPDGGLVAVSRDHVRRMLRTPVGRDEEMVTGIQRDVIRAAVDAGKSVIVDDTNLNPEHLQSLQQFALGITSSFTVCSQFLFVPLVVCVERDAQRPEAERVGGKVIVGMYKRWRLSWRQMDAFGLPDLSVIDS